MSFLVETSVRSAVVPAAVSVAVLLLWRRISPGGIGRRHAASWAVGSGFLVGNLLLQSVPVVPSSHWHWLPYLGLVAMFVGSVGQADGIHMWERWGLQLVVALLAAWFLVPDWAEIQPQRSFYLAGVAGSLFFLSAVFDWLFFRIGQGFNPVLIGLTAIGSAVVLLQSGSMKFAHLAGSLAAVNLGCGLVTLWGDWKPLFPGAVPAVIVLLGGLLFCGYVNSFSEVPLASYLLVLVSPVGSAVGLLGPIPNWPQSRRLVVQGIAVLVPLIAGVALALHAEPVL